MELLKLIFDVIGVATIVLITGLAAWIFYPRTSKERDDDRTKETPPHPRTVEGRIQLALDDLSGRPAAEREQMLVTLAVALWRENTVLHAKVDSLRGELHRPRDAGDETEAESNTNTFSERGMS